MKAFDGGEGLSKW